LKLVQLCSRKFPRSVKQDEIVIWLPFAFRASVSAASLAARLHYFRAVSAGLLACMPLELKLRGKSTTQSYRSAIFYVDLVVQTGLTLEDERAVLHDGNLKDAHLEERVLSGP
jgi:hypothetical protein